MKQLSIAQCSGNTSYWNTSYDKEKYLVDHKSLSPFDWNYYVNRLLSQYNCIPSLTAVKMLAIFINNYFVEKVEALVVFFSVYGFLCSLVIQYQLEKLLCWITKYTTP
jgi:hypothetical protein